MGMFDLVYGPDDAVYQLKCWDRVMKAYRIGDQAPTMLNYAGFEDLLTYSVALQEEPLFLNVLEGHIHSITEWPFCDDVFTKWGDSLVYPTRDYFRRP